MDALKPYFDLLAALANLLTILASSLAIYVFFAKRKELSAALTLLLNYSYQTTLAEIKEKLERLNEYRATDEQDLPEIRAIFHEIAGQLRGNPRLQSTAPNLAQRIESLAAGKRLTEPSKRAMVSEVREVLKNINVRNLEDIIGKSQ